MASEHSTILLHIFGMVFVSILAVASREYGFIFGLRIGIYVLNADARASKMLFAA